MRPWSILILLLLVVVPWSEGRAEDRFLTCPAPQATIRMVAYGDSRTDYHPAKLPLLAGILAEHPDLVLHLGDMVANAGHDLWERFDREEGQIRQAGIPFLPVVGNHERRPAPLSLEDPMIPFFARFPELAGQTWYDYRCGPMRILVLDGAAGLFPGGKQWGWLEQALRVKWDGVTILAVHPPLVSAKTNYEHAQARELLNMVERVTAGSPPRLILSSHVHNYEHFYRGGIHLVVSGGGGAPPYALNRLADDLYQGPEPNFHYLRIQGDANKIQVEMVRLDPDSGQFTVNDTFNLLPKLVNP